MSRDYMWGKKKKKRNINAEKETVETEWALTNCDDRLKLRSEMGKNELENILKHLGSWWFFREHLVLIRRDTNAKIVNATSSVAWDFLSQWCLYTNSGICSVLKQYQPTLPYTVGFPSSSKKIKIIWIPLLQARIACVVEDLHLVFLQVMHKELKCCTQERQWELICHLERD